MMKRKLAIVFLLAATGFFLHPLAFAETKYPTKPINYLIGYPPGGLSDLTGRALAAGAEKVLKKEVIVINKAGASSSLAFFMQDVYLFYPSLDSVVQHEQLPG